MIMYSKHQIFIDVHALQQFHFWEKWICRVEARHSSNYSDCSFLLEYNPFNVCFTCITWNNAKLVSIGPLGANLSEIWLEIQYFPFMKMQLEMLSAKWRPFCSEGWDGLNQAD